MADLGRLLGRLITSPERRPPAANVNRWDDLTRTNQLTDQALAAIKDALEPAAAAPYVRGRGTGVPFPLTATPVAGGAAAALTPGSAEAATGAPRDALTPPPVNPMATAASQGSNYLLKHYLPNITDPATYRPLPPPSLTSAPAPTPTMAPRLLGRGELPASTEGPITAGKVPDPNRDPRVEGIAADLANLAGSAIEGPIWMPAMMAAKGLLAPRMIPRPPINPLVWPGG